MTYTIAKLFLILNFVFVVASCDKKSTTPDDTAARQTPPSALISKADAGLDSEAVYNVIKGRKDLKNDVLGKIMKSVAQAIKGNTVNQAARDAAIVKAVKDNGGDDKLASAIKILVDKETPISPGLDDQETLGAATYALFADAAAANAKDIPALNELLKKLKPLVALDTKDKRDAAIVALKIVAAGVAGVTEAKIKTAMEIDRLGLVQGALGPKTFELFTNAATLPTATTAIVDALRAHLIPVKVVYDTTYATTALRHVAIDTMAIPAGSTVTAAAIKAAMDLDDPIGGGPGGGLNDSTGIPGGNAGATYSLFTAARDAGTDVATLNALLTKIKPPLYDDATQLTQQARGLAIDAVADIATAATAAGITLVQIKSALNTDRPLREGAVAFDIVQAPLGNATYAVFTAAANAATDDAVVTELNRILAALKGLVGAPPRLFINNADRATDVNALIVAGSPVVAAAVIAAMDVETPVGAVVLRADAGMQMNTYSLFTTSRGISAARIPALNAVFDIVKPVYDAAYPSRAVRDAALDAPPGLAAAIATLDAVDANVAGRFTLQDLKDRMQLDKPLLIAQGALAGPIYTAIQGQAALDPLQIPALNGLIPRIAPATANAGIWDSQPARADRIRALAPPANPALYAAIIGHMDATEPLDAIRLQEQGLVNGVALSLAVYNLVKNQAGLTNTQRNHILTEIEEAIGGIGGNLEPHPNREARIRAAIPAGFDAAFGNSLMDEIDNTSYAVGGVRIVPAGMDPGIVTAIEDPATIGGRTRAQMNAIMADVFQAIVDNETPVPARNDAINLTVQTNGGDGAGNLAYVTPILLAVDTAHPNLVADPGGAFTPVFTAITTGAEAVAAGRSNFQKNRIIAAVQAVIPPAAQTTLQRNAAIEAVVAPVAGNVADAAYATAIKNAVAVQYPIAVVDAATLGLDPAVYARVDGIGDITPEAKDTLLRAVRAAVNEPIAAQRTLAITGALTAAGVLPAVIGAVGPLIDIELNGKYYSPNVGISFAASRIPYDAYAAIRDFGARNVAERDALILAVRGAIEARPRHNQADRNAAIDAAVVVGGLPDDVNLKTDIKNAVNLAHPIEGVLAGAEVMLTDAATAGLDRPIYGTIWQAIGGARAAAADPVILVPNSQMNAIMAPLKLIVDARPPVRAVNDPAIDAAVRVAVGVGVGVALDPDATAWATGIKNAVNAALPDVPLVGKPARMSQATYDRIIALETLGGTLDGESNRTQINAIINGVQGAIDTLPRVKVNRDPLILAAADNGVNGIIRNDVAVDIIAEADALHPPLEARVNLALNEYQWITGNSAAGIVQTVVRTNTEMNDLIRQLEADLAFPRPSSNVGAVRVFFNNNDGNIENYLRRIQLVHAHLFAGLPGHQGKILGEYTNPTGPGYVVKITHAANGSTAVNNRVFLPVARIGDLPIKVGDTVTFATLTPGETPNAIPGRVFGTNPAKVVNANVSNYTPAP